MRGITFGLPAFVSPAGRVEPDAEVHFGLLLVLAAAEPEGIPRDEVAGLLWNSVSIDSARHSLRQTMYRLRQLGMPVQARRGLLVLGERTSDIDLRHLIRGTIERELLAHVATQPFLPGYAPQFGEGFGVWLRDLRDRVDRVRRHALGEAVREARHAARFSEIHRLAPALLALDPLNETATLCLAEALVMDGSKVEAIQMLEAYETEVGQVSDALRLPARALRKRVSEAVDDSLLPRKFEVPFVGRVEEFRELRNLFHAVRNGSARCAVITGEPGIGKTRTATELVRVGILDGALAITHQCSSGDALTPLSSLLGLTSALLSQPGALGCGQEHLSYLRRLVHPDPANPVASGMSADVAYAQLVYSLSELISAIADEAPLLVFIDDAHRLHQTSWRVFTDVVTRVPDKRVLLILTARQLPEWYPTLGINGSAEPVHLTRLLPFDRGDSYVFLDKWTAKNQVVLPEGDISAFSSQSGGNPFYLGELAAHRARGGLEDRIPPTIRALIELQFTALTGLSQRVLLAVSLLQGRATLQRVATALDVRPMEYLGSLQELEHAGLVKEAATSLRLKHDLVAEVTQARSPTSVLNFMRMRVATDLEREADAHDDSNLLSGAVDLWHRTGDVARFSTTATRLGRRLLSSGFASDAAATFARIRVSEAPAATVAAAAVLESQALSLSNEWHTLAEAPELSAEEHSSLSHEQRMTWDLGRAEARVWHVGEWPSPDLLNDAMDDTTLPAAVRLRAASLALICSDNSYGTYPLTAHIDHVQALLGEAGTLPEAVVPQLILATIRRDVEGVRKLAEALRHEAATPAESVQNIRHAAHALQRCGLAEPARRAFGASLSAARKLHLYSHVVIGIDRLISMAAHMHDDSDVRELLRYLDEIPAPAAGSYHSLAHVRCRLMTNWLGKSVSGALTIREEFSRLRSPWLGERGEAELAVMDILLCDTLSERIGGSTERYIHGPLTALLARGAVDHLAVACARCLTLSEPNAGDLFVEGYFGIWRAEQSAPAAGILARLSPSQVELATMSMRRRGLPC